MLLGIVQARALCSKMSNTDQKRSITDQQQALIYYIYKIGDITVKVALSSSSLPWSQPSNQKLLISCCQKQNLQNECQVMLSATIKLLILWISDIFMSNLNYVQETFWKKETMNNINNIKKILHFLQYRTKHHHIQKKCLNTTTHDNNQKNWSISKRLLAN